MHLAALLALSRTCYPFRAPDGIHITVFTMWAANRQIAESRSPTDKRQSSITG
jgi:hypothetical protein